MVSSLLHSTMFPVSNGIVGIFPVDQKLISWYRAKATTAAMNNSPTTERINHERIDELEENKLVADPGAVYAKELYMNL